MNGSCSPVSKVEVDSRAKRASGDAPRSVPVCSHGRTSARNAGVVLRGWSRYRDTFWCTSTDGMRPLAMTCRRRSVILLILVRICLLAAPSSLFRCRGSSQRQRFAVMAAPLYDRIYIHARNAEGLSHASSMCDDISRSTSVKDVRLRRILSLPICSQLTLSIP